MSTPETPAPSDPAPNTAPLAAWGTRAAGFLIDGAPVWILGILFGGVYRSFGGSSLLSLFGLGYFIYMGYLDGLTGQTPGKAIMGIRLVDQKGDLIGSGGGIGRKFLHILDGLVCGLGYLLPIVDTKRQTIADKLMQTFVVTGAEKRPFSVDLWMPPKQGA